VGSSASPLGNPVLDDALAWIDRRLHAEYDGGDHTIVVAAVRHLSARQDAEPLLFFKGRYAGIVPPPARGGPLAPGGECRLNHTKPGSLPGPIHAGRFLLHRDQVVSLLINTSKLAD